MKKTFFLAFVAARAHGAIRRLQNGEVRPQELNTVTEYNPPFTLQTVMMAELMWNSDENYETIRDRVLARTRRD